MDGAQERLDAAEALKKKLELILEGEAPYDIFVRWKPLEKQPIGWDPDLNDGVRLNIRPFLSVPDVGKKGAGVLRDKPNIKWEKDRGKDVASAPWYHLWAATASTITIWFLMKRAKRGGIMNKKEVLELIANGENSGVEFKLDDVRPEQLAKEIVALANLKGGRILLGVADDKSIVGITRDNLAEWVADTVFTRYVHPLFLPYYEEVLMDDGMVVAVITIGQEVSRPYVVRANDRETAYVRIGPVSRQATREQLLMLGSSSGFIHAEVMPVHRTNFNSLDRSRLENYLKDLLNDPDVPDTDAGWIVRLKALG